jgi:hypothetical protein
VVFHKIPLKSEDSVASYCANRENFNLKGAYQSKRNRVLVKSFKTALSSLVLKKNIKLLQYSFEETVD